MQFFSLSKYILLLGCLDIFRWKQDKTTLSYAYV